MGLFDRMGRSAPVYGAFGSIAGDAVNASLKSREERGLIDDIDDERARLRGVVVDTDRRGTTGWFGGR